jgi:hypothetical protein
MRRILIGALALLLMGAVVARAAAPSMEDRVRELEAKAAKVKALEAEVAKVKALEAEVAKLAALEAEVAKLKAMEPRLMKVEKHDATDRLHFTGDFRFEAHNIQAEMPDFYDGMVVQNGLVNTLFYSLQNEGDFPTSLQQVNNWIANNYGDYLYFTQNLTFGDLQAAMGEFTPEQQAGLMQMLLPAAYRQGYDVNNDVLYTSRLRLQMDSEVAENLTFAGRLGMYKPWGDSSGVQVLNGQSNSLNIDGTTVGVPNSDILRVERAYFDWKNIGGAPVYLSIGRRPSTGGAPLHLRQDEPRGGTPMGSLINFQFDGITAGWHLNEKSTVRLCYGLGYESGFGSGEQLKLPADRLKDAHFLGVNWDIWSTDQMFVQATVARAFDVTDGFNGLVVLPNNPLTGAPVGAPVVMRFTPSANLGDIDLGSLVVMRRDGPLDWFASINFNRSDPNGVTTPFGGLFSDPFQTPEKQDGNMWYAGLRYSLPNEQTRVGFEYNHGSKYWFNFAVAEDDIVAPKTSARGNVWELYATHRINKKFIAKLDYMRYDYEYSGSGWQLGDPKQLDSTPVLGFPTYDTVGKVALSVMTRF